MPRETAGAGFIRGTFHFPVVVATGTSAVEYVTDFVPGFKFVIESVKAVVRVAGTGSGATRTFNVKKGAATLAASAAVTLAATAAIGTVVDIPVTAADAEFEDADTLTVDVDSGGTQFTALTFDLIVKYRQRPQQKV
jgi:hypothetical protein